MKATYWQRGETLDYTNAGTDVIAAGTVVALGTRVGVAGTDIAPGAVGSLHVNGVYEFTKKATEAITQGAAVYYTADGITVTAGTNVPAGYAAEAAAAADATVFVKLLG